MCRFNFRCLGYGYSKIENYKEVEYLGLTTNDTNIDYFWNYNYKLSWKLLEDCKYV